MRGKSVDSITSGARRIKDQYNFRDALTINVEMSCLLEVNCLLELAMVSSGMPKDFVWGV